MTNKAIFNKAIKKAEQNGFKCSKGGVCWLQDKEPIIEGWECLKYKYLVMIGVDSLTHTFMGLNDIIFSHDFAKAFFGDKWTHFPEKYLNKILIPYWQYCLSEMVLEKEPLKYLEKFLND